MTNYDYYDSPHGRMLLVADDEAITSVSFIGQKYAPRIQGDWRRAARHAPIRQAKRELAEYFGGRRKRFSVRLAPKGTPFQRAVWQAIKSVAFGKTIAYAELARRAGRPRSARSLTGYAGGLAKKRALLALEASA
jgi:methylated-DNA-[protein]-cysteine S-methyltransferase